MTTGTNTETNAGTTPVVVISYTGEETIQVPTAIASRDDQLRSVLVASGISGAENGKIERGENGLIKLTKGAGTNG